MDRSLDQSLDPNLKELSKREHETYVSSSWSTNHQPTATSINRTHRRCSVKKGILKNFANFTGKHLCWSFFFNKVAGIEYCEISRSLFWRTSANGCFYIKTNHTTYRHPPNTNDIFSMLAAFRNQKTWIIHITISVYFRLNSICHVINQKFRSSRPEVFCEKYVLHNFTIFIGKHLCSSPFLIKLQN